MCTNILAHPQNLQLGLFHSWAAPVLVENEIKNQSSVQILLEAIAWFNFPFDYWLDAISTYSVPNCVMYTTEFVGSDLEKKQRMDVDNDLAPDPWLQPWRRWSCVCNNYQLPQFIARQWIRNGSRLLPVNFRGQNSTSKARFCIPKSR